MDLEKVEQLSKGRTKLEDIQYLISRLITNRQESGIDGTGAKIYLDQENRRKSPDQNIYSQWILNKSAKMK